MPRAQVFATTLAVVCPDCGIDQPEPDHGSLRWEPQQLPETPTKRECVGCSRTLTIQRPKRAELS